MPLPTKRSGENKESFISRCMGNKAAVDEFPDVKQRRAVCESQWDKKPKAYSSITDYLCTSQWAILPEMLDTIHSIVAARVNDEKLSIKDIEAKIDKSDESDIGAYTTDSGVRVIPINGTISKRMNLFSRVSGGASVEGLKDEIEEAITNEDVKSILLDIESPGGSVDGPFELSDFIYGSRGTKPIHAFANGLMASAAYLIGSAADKIIGTQTAQIGSIGVITKHTDYSRRNEQAGVTKTVISSGKYKAVGSDNKPLSKEDEKYIQDKLDYFYTLFVNAVARNRGVSAETVLSDMADGRVFIGQQAIDAGLMDEIGTIETSLEQISSYGGIEMNIEASGSHSSILKKDAHADVGRNEEGGEGKMTLAELKADEKLYNEMKAGIQAETKITDTGLEKRVVDLEAKLADRSAKLSERDSRIDALEKENEKKEAMRIEAEHMAKAKGIVAAKLSESQVPERLYGKVTSLVDYSQFMKDEKTEDFEALVDAEIKDWEGLNLNAAIAGMGATTRTETKTETAEQEADEARADKLFSIVK